MKKIKVVKEQVNKTEGQVPAEREKEALQALKEEDRAEEQRLFQEARAALEEHLEADARWTHKQSEAAEEKDRAEQLHEVAKRLQGEAAVLEAAAAAGEKRADALSKRAAALDAEHAAAVQRWSEAVERWEKLRYSLGLPFYDPVSGPPAWFTSPYEQQGLSQLFSAR